MNISLQIAGAERHVGELRGPAEKRGVGQSGAKLRLDAAEAILATLRWNAANEADIRAWQASAQKSKSQGQTE